MQSQTKAAKRERIARLENRLKDLRAGKYMGSIDTSIRDQIAWFTNTYWKLPPHERQELMDSWNEYYRHCLTTSETKRPNGYDPLIWDNADWAINYRQVDRELQQLASEATEFEAAVGGTW